MRRLTHEWLLGLTLLVLLLGSLIGVPVGFVVFFYGVTNGFSINEILAIPLFLAPGFLCWWGIQIFFDLGKGYLPKVRRSLFWFYVALNPYCWFWLFSPIYTGNTRFMFNDRELVINCGILLILVMAVVLMPPEKPTKPTTNTSPGSPSPISNNTEGLAEALRRDKEMDDDPAASITMEEFKESLGR